MALLALGLLAGEQRQGTTIAVHPDGSADAITRALDAAQPGDTILIGAGRYVEPPIVVRVPRVSLVGRGWPVLDGAGQHEVLVIEADDVLVSGLEVRGTGSAQVQDRAAIRLRGVRGCRIDGNRVSDNLFGIYLERSTGCTISSNQLSVSNPTVSGGGSGIHLWNSPGNRIRDNHITGHRDGIYFEFSPGNVATGNISVRNQRYGLHFMYSDSCRYERNVFQDNRSGVAVMYSHAVDIRDNTFQGARGAASYGLLMKDIQGGELSGNRFILNTSALFLDSATRLQIADNDFLENGWAVRVLANAEHNRFSGNRFAANSFDVTTNSRRSTSVFVRNWWDTYRGFDLDRDGFGDAPHYPVRLFALVVERHPDALMLTGSPVVGLLDAAERVLPVLTPAALVDASPLMRSPR